MKTSSQILIDMYKLAKQGHFSSISGDVYKSKRLTNSEAEDLVISMISGNIGKLVQRGALYFRLYCPDIFQANTWFPNTRLTELEIIMWNFSEVLLKYPGYSFRVQDREIYIEPVDEIHQHYVIFKINFELTL
jgi:hypothetical protein